MGITTYDKTAENKPKTDISYFCQIKCKIRKCADWVYFRGDIWVFIIPINGTFY